MDKIRMGKPILAATITFIQAGKTITAIVMDIYKELKESGNNYFVGYDMYLAVDAAGTAHHIHPKDVLTIIPEEK